MANDNSTTPLQLNPWAAAGTAQPYAASYNASGNIGGGGYNQQLAQMNNVQAAQLAAQNAKPKDLSWDDLKGTNINSLSDILGSGLIQNSQYDTTGLDLLGKEASRTGASDWRNLMGTQLSQKYAGLQDQLGNQAAGTLAANRNSVAMNGGLSGSAAERLAASTGNNQLLQMQNNQRQQNADATNLDIQDATNKQTAIGQLATADDAKSKFYAAQDQNNIGAALQQLGAKQNATVNNYNQNMAAWGAKQTAAATPSSGGSVICTELHRQGFMSEELYVADTFYGLTCVNPTTLTGYRFLAAPVVRAMQKSQRLTRILRVPAMAWANDMGAKMGVRSARRNVLGALINFVGQGISFVVGSCLPEKTAARLEY